MKRFDPGPIYDRGQALSEFKQGIDLSIGPGALHPPKKPAKQCKEDACVLGLSQMISAPVERQHRHDKNTRK